MSERFHVDLGGLVDLLSTHLYATPGVYVRELLQNAVDALAARRALEPDAPAAVHLDAADGALTVTDTGIGLTADEARSLLSTIASSSKRDALLGGGRREFLGQFGIGLLSAFTVASQVVVRSRSARPDAAPMEWVGRADGTFTVTELPDADLPVGSRVTLTARPGFEHWLEASTVMALAREYGGLLDADISMSVDVPGIGVRRRRLSQPELPWRVHYSSPAARERALVAHCEATFGFEPLAIIDLDAEAAGLTGVGYVLPAAVAPGAGHSRVYLKRMLLGAQVPGLLPDWAFFLRACVDAEALTPAASREQLRDDEVLAGVRAALGRQIVAWVKRTSDAGTPTARRFLETHHLALRAIAVADDDVLDLVARVLPFESSAGPLRLVDAARDGEILYAATTEEYRAIAPIAAAQGLAVVNAGYVYDADLLARLAGRPGWTTRAFTTRDIEGVLALPDSARENAAAPALAAARELMAHRDADVVLRVFEPSSCPAVLVRDRDAERRRDLDAERDAAPDLWGGLLDSLADVGHQTRTRTLALNDASPLVSTLLASSPASDAFAAGLVAVYATALLRSGEPLRGPDADDLNAALTTLLTERLDGADPSIQEPS